MVGAAYRCSSPKQVLIDGPEVGGWPALPSFPVHALAARHVQRNMMYHEADHWNVVESNRLFLSGGDWRRRLDVAAFVKKVGRAAHHVNPARWRKSHPEKVWRQTHSFRWW